jgi:hypothetical protein
MRPAKRAGLASGDFLKRLDSYTIADRVPDPTRFSEQLGRSIIRSDWLPSVVEPIFSAKLLPIP